MRIVPRLSILVCLGVGLVPPAVAGVTAALEPVAAGLVFSRLDCGTLEGTNEESSEWNLHVGLGVDLARHALHAPSNAFWGVGGAYKIARADLVPIFAAAPVTGSGWDVDLGTLFGIRLPLTSAPPNADHASCGVRVGITAINVLQNEMDSGDDSSGFESSFHFAVAADVATATGRNLNTVKKLLEQSREVLAK